MTNHIKFDRNLNQFRDKRTGRFLGLGEGITRIRAGGGVVFILDEKPEKTLKPLKKDKRWGEFQ